MTISDPYLLSALIRGITDQLAASAVPPKPDETVNHLIQRVTQASTWAKTVMQTALSQHYPDIGWSGSEAQPDSPDEAAARPYWVYDPIDGAYHYIQGLPLWSSSLALISEGRTVFSIVYEPSLHELFVATEFGGAALNGAPLRVSGKSDLRTAVVATALPPLDTATRTNTVDRLRCLAQCPGVCLSCGRWLPRRCSWLMWLRDGWMPIGKPATIYTTGSRVRCWSGKLEVRSLTLPVRR